MEKENKEPGVALMYFIIMIVVFLAGTTIKKRE